MTEQQWMEIYRETVHPVYAYVARRTGGDRALTEDIVQEAYLRALGSWNRKSKPDSPLAWLKRVARNILVDYLRQKKWDTGADLDHHSDTDGRTAEDRFRSLEIFAAISLLGRRKAGILEGFYYEGKSLREIANAMSLSERAVEGQLRRARQSLKPLLPDLKTHGGKNE